MNISFVEDLARNFDDLPTGRAAAVFFLKVIRGEEYTHAQIAEVLSVSLREVDDAERLGRQEFQIMEWRKRIREMKDRLEAGERLLY